MSPVDYTPEAGLFQHVVRSRVIGAAYTRLLEQPAFLWASVFGAAQAGNYWVSLGAHAPG